MAASFFPRIYTNRFLVANQIIVRQNPLTVPGSSSGPSMHTNCIGNLLYLVPYGINSGIQQGYIHSYNTDTKTFSTYTQIPDCTLPWGIEVVGTDLYVPSNARSVNRPAYFKSTDGGSTWSSVIFPEAGNPIVVIRAMKFSPFNSQNGIVFGVESAGTANAWYSRTTDGGTTWSTWVQMPTIRGVYDIKYLDDSTIIFSGTNSSNVGITRMSTDGGVTWGSILTFPGTIICSCMSWLDAKVGYIAARTNQIVTAGAGQLYITTDGGITWSLLASMPSNMKSVVNVYAISRSLIVLNGYDAINTRCIMNVTRDGGLTWKQIIALSNNSSTRIIRKGNSLFTCGNTRTLFEIKIAG